MKLIKSFSFKKSIVNFSELYFQCKSDLKKLTETKYTISSSLDYYKQTGMIKLSHNDKPGEYLPATDIIEIKNNLDLITGLHPVDVNSINDLYYLAQDKISKLIVTGDKIEVFNERDEYAQYDVREDFVHGNLLSKRVSFLIGYMQAEKVLSKNYNVQNKYKIMQDNITTLVIFDNETGETVIKNPLDILFSDEYKYFSKEDIGRIGYICGQMSTLHHSKDNIA